MCIYYRRNGHPVSRSQGPALLKCTTTEPFFRSRSSSYESSKKCGAKANRLSREAFRLLRSHTQIRRLHIHCNLEGLPYGKCKEAQKEPPIAFCDCIDEFFGRRKFRTRDICDNNNNICTRAKQSFIELNCNDLWEQGRKKCDHVPPSQQPYREQIVSHPPSSHVTVTVLVLSATRSVGGL